MAFPPTDPGGLPSGLDALVFLVVGFLSSAHCLAMCGPLVGVYADRLRAQSPGAAPSRWKLVRQQTLFNLGRAGAYALVGAFLGLAGALAVGALDALMAVGSIVRGVTGLLAGAAIAATGVSYVRGSTRHPTIPGAGRVFTDLSRSLRARVDALVGDARVVGLGAAHALLPCPITYPAYIYAFAIADPWHGGLLLGLLGLGTIPPLLAYGTAMGSVTPSRGHHRVMGVAFLVLSLVAISHGLNALGVPVPRVPIPVPEPLGG